MQSSNPEHQIRIRNLAVYLSHGGCVTDARLVEGLDERWTMWLRLAGRPGEYRLNVYRSDQPKAYRDVRLAIDTIRTDLGYAGAITLATEKPVGKAGAHARPMGEADDED